MDRQTDGRRQTRRPKHKALTLTVYEPNKARTVAANESNCVVIPQRYLLEFHSLSLITHLTLVILLISICVRLKP